MRSGLVRFAAGAGALVALASCAASTSAPATSPSPSSPAATPSSVASPSLAASPSALPAGIKGYGDTAANPNTANGSVICIFSSSINGQAIAYLEVSGSDAVAGQAVCNTFESVNGGHTWVAVTAGRVSLTTLDIHTGCYDTIGSVTARIYTPANSSSVDALTLCRYSPADGGFGV